MTMITMVGWQKNRNSIYFILDWSLFCDPFIQLDLLGWCSYYNDMVSQNQTGISLNFGKWKSLKHWTFLYVKISKDQFIAAEVGIAQLNNAQPLYVSFI